ncbi:hypothetical protein BCR37DRAFT_254942 [Protomyces lactucae-debilis]|uniref:Uncharacterized protein n=1 Tax=Protomyces lactucae-debilis TaxID=2754530 RepID=A0A1Y2FLS2_PROLT|nr:uncharacterized protein BCR37DRAFT_254942 [Protomyces lactucae-debilis]ORY84941.1 hypothetical protein BCR37DRAFT_254942 [Protomyces lactucae-debilis]
MQLRWHVWPMPIKLALCSLCMALLLYHLAGAPTRSKGKSIGTFETKDSNKEQPPIEGAAPTSTGQNEFISRSFTSESERGCYDMILVIESFAPRQVDPATCGNAAALEKHEKKCKRRCKAAAERYKEEFFRPARQKTFFVRDSCLQSDKLAAVIQDDAFLQPIGSDSCTVTCACKISNQIRIRMPVIKSNGIKFVVTPFRSKIFWTASREKPVAIEGIPTCHPEDMVTRWSLSGFKTPDFPEWKSRYEVIKLNLPCDYIQWGVTCYCSNLAKALGDYRKHKFRPSFCGERPVLQKQPSQRAGKSKKARVDSAAKGPQPDDFAGPTRPTEPGSQRSSAAVIGGLDDFDDLADTSQVLDLFRPLWDIQPNENGVPQFPQQGECSYYAPLESDQCQASHDPSATRPDQYMGQYSGNPRTSYEQQQCGTSTSCNPSGSLLQKRQESKRDEGVAGSRCTPGSGAVHEQRPAPFI